jgi:hypothetical protein
MMNRMRRLFGTFLLGAALVLPLAATGCAVGYRNYDRDRHERHWDRHDRDHHEQRDRGNDWRQGDDR